MLNATTYLVVSDYFSQYLEVIKLIATVSSTVISGFKSLFARYGIPEEVVSDNGLQYKSGGILQFCQAIQLSSYH